MIGHAPFVVSTWHYLAETVLAVYLKPKGEPLSFIAGQYVEVHVRNQSFHFSLAHPPKNDGSICFQIRFQAGNAVHQALWEALTQNEVVYISDALGDCHVTTLSDDTKPLIMLVRGTGVAPMQAMLEYWHEKGDERQKSLIWFSRSKRSIYDTPILTACIKDSNLEYSTIIDASLNYEGLVAHLIKHQKEIYSANFVLAGPFDMVSALTQNFLESGIKRSALYSDAYAFIDM